MLMEEMLVDQVAATVVIAFESTGSGAVSNFRSSLINHQAVI